MQILGSIPRLIRRPSAANSPALRHRLSSPSRPPSSMASAPARWWPPVLAPRVFPFMAAPNPSVRRVSRLPHVTRGMATISGVKGDLSGKLLRRLPIPSANVIIISQGKKYLAVTQGMKSIETRDTISDVKDEDKINDKDSCRITSEVVDGKRDTWGQIVNLTGCEENQRSATEDHTGDIFVCDDEEVSDDEEDAVSDVLEESRHRDGSMYRGMDLWWKRDFHIADLNETRGEAMMLSDPKNCIIQNGTCVRHVSVRMLQIFSIELAEISLDGGFVELYGYIAVRDNLDGLLNYVVNFSRDDPIIVKQGSLINMDGPKRGIQMLDHTLIEYDMRIKTGEQEKNDLQLIDGASLIGPAGPWNSISEIWIPGDYGAVEITYSPLDSAVEATVEVHISEVQSSFNLSLSCFTSRLDEEIRLYDGTITESRGLKRSVFAVRKRYLIDLNFKVSQSSSSEEHCCSFKAKTHGHDIQEVKTDFALISMKVIWSTLPWSVHGWPLHTSRSVTSGLRN